MSLTSPPLFFTFQLIAHSRLPRQCKDGAPEVLMNAPIEGQGTELPWKYELIVRPTFQLPLSCRLFPTLSDSSFTLASLCALRGANGCSCCQPVAKLMTTYEAPCKRIKMVACPYILTFLLPGATIIKTACATTGKAMSSAPIYNHTCAIGSNVK